jgi:hypothetical protein
LAFTIGKIYANMEKMNKIHREKEEELGKYTKEELL